MKSLSKQKPSKNQKSLKASPQRKESDDFTSVARRLECDEDKGRFEKALSKIVKAVSAKKAAR